MKIARCAPSYNLGRVADFDQWLRHPFTGYSAVDQLLSELLPSGTSSRLATDVYEDKDNYFARFELPGVKKEDVKVEVHNRLLTISAERHEKSADGEQSFSLSRSVSVPEGIRGEAIAAKLEDGILTVTLPKEEQRKPKLIDVN